jgi:hypothetical protein
MNRLSLIDQVRGSLHDIGPAAVLHCLANSVRGLAEAEAHDAYGRAEAVRAAEQLEAAARTIPPTFRFRKEKS